MANQKKDPPVVDPAAAPEDAPVPQSVEGRIPSEKQFPTGVKLIRFTGPDTNAIDDSHVDVEIHNVDGLQVKPSALHSDLASYDMLFPGDSLIAHAVSVDLVDEIAAKMAMLFKAKA